MNQGPSYDVWIPEDGPVSDPDDLRHGPFADLEEAIAYCEAEIDRRLVPLCGHGASVDDVLRALLASGPLPFISAPMDPAAGEFFDAERYARARAAWLCGGG